MGPYDEFIGKNFTTKDKHVATILNTESYYESGHKRWTLTVFWEDGTKEILKKGKFENLLKGEYTRFPYVTADHEGTTFRSVKEMCAHWGVPYSEYQSRVNKLGWDSKKALTTEHNPEREGTVLATSDGKRYASINKASKATGIPKTVIQNRLNSGMSADEALFTPVKRHSYACTDHRGIPYSTMEEMANAYGIPPHTLYSRINKHGWDTKRALTTPVKKMAAYVVGEKVKQNNGQIAELMEITSSSRGNIRFEDGTIVNRSLPEFRRGNVSNPNFGSRIGEKRMANCGLVMEIIKDAHKKNITVRFEDGTVKSGVAYSAFQVGKVAHPTFCADTRKDGEFCGYKVRAIGLIADKVYYKTENIKTGEKDIMTPQEMMEKKCK